MDYGIPNHIAQQKANIINQTNYEPMKKNHLLNSFHLAENSLAGSGQGEHLSAGP